MLVSTALLALLLVTPLPPGHGPPEAVAVVPDEPGAVVLPDAAILQTVAADLDGDRRREVVRLVRGADEAVLAEVWGQADDGWRLRGDPVEVVPPGRVGTRIDPVYQSTPVRLLVRHVDGAERVSVVSQPHFEAIDVGAPCCLLINDLAVEDGVAVRHNVADPADFADAVIVIDLDGDGTDELLSTQSLPPEGDISFPILARVHRWSDGAFAPPTETRLPVGSGDSPFRLGDSDGLPGDEAAIISTLGPQGIFRIRLAEDDALALDAGAVVADQAIAVPIGDRRGVALTGPVAGLMVAPWPPGEPIGAPSAESPVSGARLVGNVTVLDQPRLVVAQPSTGAIHLLGLPDLLPPQGITITRSPAAAALSGLPVTPYSGPLPGGGARGEPVVVHDGRMIPAAPALADRSGTALIATLAGAEPVGLVGAGNLLALHHGPVGRPAPDRGGGALVVPAALDGGWTSIAPLDLAAMPEPDGADLEPPLRDAITLGARGGIAVGRGGFVADVTAPPGSRVLVADLDPSVVRTPIVVPASGRVAAPFVPPAVITPNPRYRATLLVLTPAGHALRAAWDVRVRTEAPEVQLTTSTPIGSTAVQLRGRTASGAVVLLAGRPVEVDSHGRFAAVVELPPWPTDVIVEVDDRLGNVARHAVTGVGVFDYRGLPWAAVTLSALAIAGAVLFLRVPRSAPLPRRPGDDSALEDLEPD
ncbi:MAG: hypothetical protein M3153_02060 [Chloroflexota bacterium]|nr:hypothetical protein [Chloroflexota bacterium]